MSKFEWSNEDGVALREFFARVPANKVEVLLKQTCPATITADMVLNNDAEAIARTAAMEAGWNGCIQALMALAFRDKKNQPEAGYRDMT